MRIAQLTLLTRFPLWLSRSAVLVVDHFVCKVYHAPRILLYRIIVHSIVGDGANTVTYHMLVDIYISYHRNKYDMYIHIIPQYIIIRKIDRYTFLVVRVGRSHESRVTHESDMAVPCCSQHFVLLSTSHEATSHESISLPLIADATRAEGIVSLS